MKKVKLEVTAVIRTDGEYCAKECTYTDIESSGQTCYLFNSILYYQLTNGDYTWKRCIKCLNAESESK